MAKRALLLGVLLGVGILLLAAGCRSVRRYDPGVEAVKILDFNSQDFRLIVEKMVGSLLDDEIVNRPGKQPVCYVHSITNRTGEHIDTKSILISIRTRLARSKQITFVDADVLGEITSQIEFQQSDLVDPATALRFGKLIGADYFLYGNISSLEAKAGRKKAVYYAVTLNLLDIEHGTIVWADEKEIQKVEKRGIFGL